MLYFRSLIVRTQDMEALKESIATQGMDASLVFLAGREDMASNLVAKVLGASQSKMHDSQAIIEQLIRSVETKLDQHLPLLSSIITVAPILGLLGTVLGLMDVFNVISGGGLGDATQLSSGIAEALITTVLGLSISIPFIFAYQLLNSQIEARLQSLELTLEHLDQFCQQQGLRRDSSYAEG